MKSKTKKRVTKADRFSMRRDFGPNDRAVEKIRAALLVHDKTVSDYESRWGVDRLPDLVEPELRARFELQCDKLNKAIRESNVDEVEKLVAVSCRAYAALEKAAKEAGAKELTGEAWEAAIPSGGVLCVTKSDYEAVKVAKERPDAVVWSVEEVARVIDAYDASKLMSLVKAKMPDAIFSGVQAKGGDLNDDVPF